MQTVLFLKAVRRGRLLERKRLADQHAELVFRQPAVHVVGASALFVWAGIEHGEAIQGEVFDVKRADWKDRLSLPAGQDYNPPARGHEGHCAKKVGFALGL